MQKILSEFLFDFVPNKKIEEDITDLFILHGYKDIAEHSIKVAKEAMRLARKFEFSEETAFVAGCLHDIGNIISSDHRVSTCIKLGIEVLEEEKIAPSLLHSKLSRVMAFEIFNIKDEDILNAIECHSTLKANPSELDMILFISDKIQWESQYNQGFITKVIQGLDISLENAALAYLQYLYDHRGSVKVFHPWTLAAYNELRSKCERC